MHQLTRQMGEVRVEQQAIHGDISQNHQFITTAQNEQAYN